MVMANRTSWRGLTDSMTGQLQNRSALDAGVDVGLQKNIHKRRRCLVEKEEKRRTREVEVTMLRHYSKYLLKITMEGNTDNNLINM